MGLKQARRLCVGALLAAMICLATMLIKLPIAVAHGYVHPGDIFIYLAAMTLGPPAGLSAAIGSALADALSGIYAVYAPPTLLIKGLMGYAAGRALGGIGSVRSAVSAASVKKRGVLYHAVVFGACGAFMAMGYWLVDTMLFGAAAAAAAVPMNLLQGLFGAVGGTLLSRANLGRLKPFLDG